MDCITHLTTCQKHNSFVRSTSCQFQIKQIRSIFLNSLLSYHRLHMSISMHASTIIALVTTNKCFSICSQDVHVYSLTRTRSRYFQWLCTPLLCEGSLSVVTRVYLCIAPANVQVLFWLRCSTYADCIWCKREDCTKVLIFIFNVLQQVNNVFGSVVVIRIIFWTHGSM